MPLIQHSLGDVGKYDNVEIARKLAAKIQFEAETAGTDPKAEKLAASKTLKSGFDFDTQYIRRVEHSHEAANERTQASSA